MLMIDRVSIARRFQRSIRIDTDLTNPKALEGFVCPRSSADVLLTMARHFSESGHAAFTWTGPYGTGKSSLAVAFSALLNGNKSLRKQATNIFGRQMATAMWSALPSGTKGWQIIPIVGRREDPVRVVGEGLEVAKLVKYKPRGGWTEKQVVDVLVNTAARSSKKQSGVVLVIDEMGKFLEAAANDNTDIYIFQQLAEAANRSKGHFILIGVLHQAFGEYALRLSHQMRDEWTKIQGRFVDLAVNTAGDEQIELVSRAIENKRHTKVPSSAAVLVAAILRGGRKVDSNRLASTLESCWPLHPAVAGLLGPISRRRFGQNQRSIFGFLNSSEPYGFQDFIHHASEDEVYTPDRLWDYLRANLEPSILTSPDGHRWALAAEALERCEAVGGDGLHLRLLKTIAVIDLFKERSGLIPSMDLLKSCFQANSTISIKRAISQLAGWSFIVFKKFLGGYGIFAGSDFDIEEALTAALEDVGEVNFSVLKTLAGLQPILAKRHYHKTGALRWFDLDVIAVRNLLDVVRSYTPRNGIVGRFLLAIPTEGEGDSEVADLCREAVGISPGWDVVVGISKNSSSTVTLAHELLALDVVRRERPELAGDSVARRELTARIASVQARLESQLHKALDGALWYQPLGEPKMYRQASLNSLASDLADRRFNLSPHLHNELLNRQKPSSSAIAAQNVLLKRMVLNEGQPRLGIGGFSADGGLFVSILEATGLYANSSQGWHFVPPDQSEYRLAPVWKAAVEHMKGNSDRIVPVSEIYGIWRKAPYGLKEGLMPILAVAFIMSQRDRIAVYRDGMFRARFDDVDVEYLAKDSSFIQLRWMELSEGARGLLSELADVVRTLDRSNTLTHLEPIDVARGLVAIYEHLPLWTKRTMNLSTNAVRVRGVVKQARDPNQFLFRDIPSAFCGGPISGGESLKKVIGNIREGLEELVEAYPSMLRRLRDIMLAELEVPNSSPQSIAELRGRAKNIRQLVGDFHLEAFITRLSQFDGTDLSFEGIGSLAANKPPRDWVDPDVDRVVIGIAELAQKFLRAEMFARVQGRREKREAIAIVIGKHGHPRPMIEEFAIRNGDRKKVNEIVERVCDALGQANGQRRSVILAALAEVSARYMSKSDHVTGSNLSRRRVV